MKRILTYTLILVLFCNMKCEDSEEDYLAAGIETRVFGNIYDIPNQLPIVNQKLIVAEYYREFAGIRGSVDVYVQDVDSIVTDDNGNFDLTFKTAGSGTKYKIYPAHNNLIWTYFQNPVDIPIIEGTNELNFNFENLYTCTLMINLDDAQHPPFVLNSFLTLDSELPNITEDSGIVERKIYLSSYSSEELYIGRQLPGGRRQSAKFDIPPSFNLEIRELEIILKDEDFQ